MALRAAVAGDTVSYRDAQGKTFNATVIGTQPAIQPATGWSVANSGTGGTLTAATYSYYITRVINGVESAPTALAKTTIVAGGTTNKVTLTLPGETGVSYGIYGRVGASELLIAYTAAAAESYDDTGALTPAGALPTADGRIGLLGGAKRGLPTTAASKVLLATDVHDVNVYFLRT